MKHIEEIVDVLEKVCQRIAIKPDEIFVKCTIDGYTAKINVLSSPQDTMKLIGSGGNTAKSLELIARAMADSIDMNMRVKVDPTERIRQAWLPFEPNPKYSPAVEIGLLKRIVSMIYDDGAQVKPVKVADDTTALIATVDGPFVQELENALTTVFEPMARNHGQNMYVELDAA